MHIISLGFVVSSVSVISCGALEGLGQGRPSLIISLLRYALLIIPAAYILSRFLGAVGVWHAFWVTEVVTAVVSYALYKSRDNAQTCEQKRRPACKKPRTIRRPGLWCG